MANNEIRRAEHFGRDSLKDFTMFRGISGFDLRLCFPLLIFRIIVNCSFKKKKKPIMVNSKRRNQTKAQLHV